MKLKKILYNAVILLKYLKSKTKELMSWNLVFNLYCNILNALTRTEMYLQYNWRIGLCT